MRKSLTTEFSSLYVFNLRGNARTSGEQRRKEKDGVFGSGSRATVAISILVKNPDAAEHGRLHYRDIGDYLTREQKLGLIAQYGSVDGVPWDVLEPNEAGDWLDQRNDAFTSFIPIGAKHGSNLETSTVFKTYSRGLETGRDAWVYNASATAVWENVTRTAEAFNLLVERYGKEMSGQPKSSRKAIAERYLDPDSRAISWTLSLKNRLFARKAIELHRDSIRVGMYRPFNKQNVYFDRALNHILGQTTRIFPTVSQENIGFYITAPGSGRDFAAIMVDELPDLCLSGAGSGQFFPRYTYEARGEQPSLFEDGDPHTRVDNITDEILAEYRGLYGAAVTKDEVFFFVYGLLHSPDYRERYASDLKKMLPRIPQLGLSMRSGTEDFWAFAKAGRELSELHLDYESVEPYPLEVSIRPRAAYSNAGTGSTTGASMNSATEGGDLRVTKMRFAGKMGAWDRSTIRYNEDITLSGIPDEAYEYLLGSRSAIEWILERYQMKTDRASGIVNDPNAWGEEHGNPSYILDLLRSIVTVSVDTVRIVKSLPPLHIAERQ